MESLHGKFGKDVTALSSVRRFNWDLDSLLGGVDATVVFFCIIFISGRVKYVHTLYVGISKHLVMKCVCIWNNV